VAAVETILASARAAGRPSLVTYVTGGIRDDWTDVLAAMTAAGADAVEIGLPFSDPMLDGPVIQRASAVAIGRGATNAGILADLRAARASADTRRAADARRAGAGAGTAADASAAVGRGAVPLIAMAYANHAWHRGLGRYCRELAAAGISGTIIPDLPVGEADSYLAAAAEAGLDATLMTTPATPEAQLRAIAARSRGFLYVMSVMATTGSTRERDDASRWAVAARARQHSPRPVLIGFGIDSPARAAAAVQHADGVIVASALMRRVLDGATPAEIGQDVAALRAAIDQARP
jgi:tryptophan synthase alpha chain